MLSLKIISHLRRLDQLNWFPAQTFDSERIYGRLGEVLGRVPAEVKHLWEDSRVGFRPTSLRGSWRAGIARSRPAPGCCWRWRRSAGRRVRATAEKTSSWGQLTFPLRRDNKFSGILRNDQTTSTSTFEWWWWLNELNENMEEGQEVQNISYFRFHNQNVCGCKPNLPGNLYQTTWSSSI